MTPTSEHLDMAFPPEECIYTVAMTTYGPALHCEGFFGQDGLGEPQATLALPHLPYWYGQAG